MGKSFKSMIKGMALSIMVAAAIAGAHRNVRADIITIASNGTAADAGETNTTGGPTVVIPPNSAWAAALPGSSWVSFTQSGDPGGAGYTQVMNGTIVTFNQTFTLTGGAPVSGSLTVRADDSASVRLNGIVIASEATMAGNTYATCSDFAIGCLATTQRTFTFAELQPYLLPGLNTFSFSVAQREMVSFGLNYAGSITTASAVPEPATMILLGTSMAGLAGAARRRRSKVTRD